MFALVAVMFHGPRYDITLRSLSSSGLVYVPRAVSVECSSKLNDPTDEDEESDGKLASFQTVLKSASRSRIGDFGSQVIKVQSKRPIQL